MWLQGGKLMSGYDGFLIFYVKHVAECMFLQMA